MVAKLKRKCYFYNTEKEKEGGDTGRKGNRMKHIGIKKDIVARIRMMAPNEKLSSRNAMCIRYGAARSTIDNIISELVQEGLVYTIQGSGTFVSPNNQDVPAKTAGRANTWAILIPDMRTEIYPELYAGLDSYADEENIAIVVCNTNDDPVREYSYIQTLVAANVNGMIIVPALKGGNNIRGYQYLMNCNVPFVFWNRSFDYMPDVPQVCLNGYQGGRIAVNHFLEKGYRKIAYISSIRFRSSMDRFFGYCSALNDAGIDINYQHVRLEIDSASGKNGGAITSAALEMLSLPEPPDAFLCFTDEMAVSVAHAIKEKSLTVSDDVGLIGFESAVPISKHALDFELTYVSLNSYESGRRVAQILNQMMYDSHSQVSKVHVFNPILVVKDSCAGKRMNAAASEDRKRSVKHA